jgi:hypothetical protein
MAFGGTTVGSTPLCEVKVLTSDGPVRVQRLGDLLDRLDRIPPGGFTPEAPGNPGATAYRLA